MDEKKTIRKPSVIFYNCLAPVCLAPICNARVQVHMKTNKNYASTNIRKHPFYIIFLFYTYLSAFLIRQIRQRQKIAVIRHLLIGNP